MTRRSILAKLEQTHKCKLCERFEDNDCESILAFICARSRVIARAIATMILNSGPAVPIIERRILAPFPALVRNYRKRTLLGFAAIAREV